MKNRVVSLPAGQPLLDIKSLGRVSSAKRLTPQLPGPYRRSGAGGVEVMVKVSGGAKSLKGVATHFNYIGRDGRGVIDTDDGERLQLKGFEKQLLKEWDLDLVALGCDRMHGVARRRIPAKLVHNLVFSMPRATDPEKLQRTVREFANEAFALKHRYAMTLHTDQGHPHVHLVVKAMSEQGVRLNIKKQTLRDWRQRFAHHLREQGIDAVATDRASRGLSRRRVPDGRYRSLKLQADRSPAVGIVSPEKQKSRKRTY